MSTLLEAKDLSAGYGPVEVIHDIQMKVEPGEVVAVLGANGAGKTTTMLSLSGELPVSGGEVLFDGEVTHSPLYRRSRDGMAYVPEGRSVFTGMSAADNLRVAGVDQDRVLALFPELEKRLNVAAGLLSGGEQQMLTLGRALAREPKLLLADELSLGLAPLVVTRLLKAVRDAADQHGTGALLVEQHARKALRYSDRVYVMQRGRVVMSATSTDARTNISELEAAYLTSGTD
jgi:branched-chain amino acid transport system ATP-binding protein